MEQKIKKPVNVAIDGPAGSGKSTVSRLAAKELGFLYLDTGALYRTIGLYVYRQGIGEKDAARIVPLLGQIHIEVRFSGGTQQVYLNEEEVSEQIRLPEISVYASGVSAIAEVRAFLLHLQTDIAARENVIMDGRDIGTVVLPDAQVKIFLMADAKIRARRRYDELRTKGAKVSFDQVLEDMIRRDQQDSGRAIAPLKAAVDAIRLDTSAMSIQQVVAFIVGKVREITDEI